MQEKNGVSQIRNWIKNSVSLKLITISILALCLLIPGSMVKSIIHERSNLNYQANEEVRAKWAYAQTICAPILSVPIVEEYIVDEEKIYRKSWYHFLPHELNVDAEVDPKTLKRGIYEVIVYNSDIDIAGSFSVPSDFESNQFYEIRWEDAFVTVGITDLRGIKNDLYLDWETQKINSIPGTKIQETIASGLTFPVSNLSPDFKDINFALSVELQGSSQLAFAPLGKTTKLHMSSEWPAPSFTGSFLPDEREVDKSGFIASWDILQINRNFPQHWENGDQTLSISSTIFGVDFILPSDAYQKSIRSIKYALMNIALTFLIFFIVEIFTRRKIHPFQYVMVGLSIILFYVLLVSLSEHVGFDEAYIIAATAVVSMIYLYSLTIFKSLKFSLFLLGLSIMNYGFIYITLQMTEYALLLGAVSMTTILALVMYGTRDIDWYNLSRITLENDDPLSEKE